MADALSAAAGIIGVLTAAVQISKLLIDFTKRTKDAPRQASQVLSEVNAVHTIMTQLQAFLFGLNTPDQSQACHVQVESLLSVLTGCVATFSDLEQLLDQMKSEDLTMLDRLKWARKESALEALISRLQIHKSSLTLILEIVNGSTMQDVKMTVRRLDQTLNDNYQEILSRLQALEMPPSTSQRLPSRMSTSRASAASRNSYSRDEGHNTDLAHRHQRSSRVFGFVFEPELAMSKVYRKVLFGGSTSSLLTTDDPKTTWSMFSAPSIADVVSRLSVFNLAINTAEVYHAAQYTSADTESSEITTQASTNSFIVPKKQAGVYHFHEMIVQETRRMKEIADYSNESFLDLDSGWTESTSIELIRRIYMCLNLIPALNEARGFNPTIFISFIVQERKLSGDKTIFCWVKELTEDAWPLHLFAQLQRERRQPVLVLSVAEDPFRRRIEMLQMREVGYTLDGWVIDAKLYRLSNLLRPPAKVDKFMWGGKSTIAEVNQIPRHIPSPTMLS